MVERRKGGSEEKIIRRDDSMALKLYDKQVPVCNNTCKKLEEVVEEV